jgi:hypothetical protein
MSAGSQLGRPVEQVPQEIAQIVCDRLMAGESLRSIAEDESMPAPSTVCAWVLKDPVFREQYAHARAVQAELLADEIFSIADDGSNDWQETKHGPMFNKEAVQRSALRVDTRKWYLSKVLPKVYGDKLIHQGDADKPIELVVRHIGARVIEGEK